MEATASFIVSRMLDATWADVVHDHDCRVVIENTSQLYTPCGLQHAYCDALCVYASWAIVHA